MKNKTTAKPALKFIAAAIMPSLYLMFIITDHYEIWDSIRGLNKVKAVAARMNLSYTEAKRQYRPGDDEWKPTIALIERYSKAELPRGRQPIVLARLQAVASAKAEVGPGKFAEWTAPTTPLLFLYSESPLSWNDTMVVGDIGDLFVWIEKSKSDFRFYVQNVLLGVFSVTLGALIWGIEHRERSQKYKIW